MMNDAGQRSSHDVGQRSSQGGATGNQLVRNTRTNMVSTRFTKFNDYVM